MSCIRYKFKNSLVYDKVTFEGLQISVSDLREKIINLKKISSDNTLDIMDPRTKKVFSDDVLIPRNSSVVIIKIPKLTQQKFSKIKDFSSSKDDTMLSVDQLLSTKSLSLSHQDDAMLSVDQLRKTANLAEANASEEDKVRAMMSQAGEDYNPLSYAKFKIKGGGAVGGAISNVKPPPANYICHRCNQKGHWIKFCPTNGDPNFDNMKLRRSYGIPSSQLTMSTTNTPGAMMDRFGNIVIRKNDLGGVVTEYEEETVPPELTCNICKELVKDAVIIMCCAESFCAECITNHLMENDFSCYLCHASDVSPESLVPNKSLRAAAKTFQSKQIEKKSIALARGLPSAPLPSNVSSTIASSTVSSSPPLNEDRTPSPVPLSTTANTAITTQVVVSPPKPTITAPIIIQPPPVHRFPHPSSVVPTMRPSLIMSTGVYPAPTVAAPVVLNPFLAPPRPSADPVMRLTELLVASDRPRDGRNSPPPLSAEEFYQQQKMFRNIRSRSPSPYYRSRSPHRSKKHKDKKKKKN